MSTKLGADPRPRRFDVTISEKLTDGTLLYDNVEVKGIEAAPQTLVEYSGGDRKGRRLEPQISPLIDQGQLWRATQVVATADKPVLTLEANDGRSVTARARPELVKRVEELVHPIDMDAAITDVDSIFDHLDPADLFETEDPQTLAAPDLEFTISGYTKVSTMSSGQVVRTPVLGYLRATTREATGSEFELHKKTANDPG